MNITNIRKIAHTVMVPLAQKIKDAGAHIIFISVVNGPTLAAMLIALKEIGMLTTGYDSTKLHSN